MSVNATDKRAKAEAEAQGKAPEEKAAIERAAQERLALERATAKTFELSPRELEIQKTLGAANAPRKEGK